MKLNILSLVKFLLVTFLISLFGCTTIGINELIEKGHFNEASEYCKNLKDGEQKDCYSLLTDASIGRNDYDNAVNYYIKANEKIIFQDHFENNNNNWNEINDNKEVFKKVVNGKYIFEQKREKGSWYTWSKTSISIDDSDDFIIESTMKKTSGIDDHRYEIVWGMKDVDNNYAFGISGDGSFRYGKTVNGKWEALTDWTKSEYINKYNTSNTLAVKKSGDKLMFLINGNIVAEKPYEEFFGGKIGFCLNNKMKVEFDNIIITQFPNKEKAYKKLFDKCLAQGNCLPFLNNCEKAGYTKNQAYIKTAEAHLENGNYESSVLNLERAGWSINNLDSSVIFEENFNDNKNGWFEKTNNEVSYKVQNGQYCFEHKRKEGGWFSWPKTVVNINESGDFKIESTITKVDGKDDHLYSIVWGIKGNNNYHKFGITGDGYYRYCMEENGVWKEITKWTESAHINKGNLTNTLAVEKTGDSLKMYINGHFVNEKPYIRLNGNKVGFNLNNNIKVEIDNIIVSQTPPKIAYALATRRPLKVDTEDTKKIEDDVLRRDVSPIETKTKR